MHRAEDIAVREGRAGAAPDADAKRTGESVGVFGFELGADFVTGAGEGFRALFGVRAGERFDWDVWSARLHPEDRERVFADFARLLTLGGAAAIEFRVVRVGEATRRILARARSVAGREAPLRLAGAAVEVREIEERDEAAQALRPPPCAAVQGLDPEELLRALGEASQDLVCARDLEGRVLWANAAMLDLLGRPEREVLGRTLFDLLGDEAQAMAVRDAQVAGAGWPETHEEAITHAGLGERRIYQSTRSPLRDASGGVIGVIGVSRDVSAVRKGEHALAETEAKLRLVLERAPVCMIVLDTELRYLAVSRRYVRDYHIEVEDADELIGRSHYEVFPNTPERHREAFSRALAGELQSADNDSCVRDDGRVDWVHWEMTPWRRSDGEIGGVFLFTEIATAQNEAQAVLSRDRAQLERLVQERSEALQRTQARLAQAEKLTALGQLAGGIAHDFNNVMQAVQGGANLIMRRCDDPAQVVRLAGMIEEAARRGSGFTRRLLAFSRKSELKPEPVNAAAVLEGLRELLTHTFPAGIEVSVDAAEGLPPLAADRGELETVLVNLATNARDAMPAGGRLAFTARLETVRPEQQQALELAPGAYVRLEVCDSGSGMDEPTLARALEPFFTTKPLGSGTGLGLPMARGFAEQSGGRLAIESRPGRGTRVTLWLPKARSPSTVQPPAEPLHRLRAQLHDPEHILVVDDEDAVREVLASELAEYGYVVRQARSGAQALASLDAGERVDLIVSDLAMPGMDGLALIEAARARRPTLPALLVTGFAGEAAVLAESCAFRLMRKPVSGEQLAASVCETLGPLRRGAVQAAGSSGGRLQ